MRNKKNVKILVCCHKQDVMASQEPYMPIHVGKALHPELDLGIQGDNTGENISDKNGSYCELTGMYWAWKNLKDVDIIGLCHYRRYFDFHGQVPFYKHSQRFVTDDFQNLDLSIPDKLIESVSNGSVVVAKPKHYGTSVAADYCIEHISDDFRILQSVIYKTQPEYIKNAFFKVFHQSNKVMHYNMCIMNWKDFDSYCSWMFDILRQVENLTDISHYNPIQKRIYGYMSERLFIVWLVAEKKRLIQKPVLFINDNQPVYPDRNLIKSLLWNIRSDLAMRLVAQRVKRARG